MHQLTHRCAGAVFVAGFMTWMTAALNAQTINHPAGFTGQTDLTFNGSATVQASGNAQLTPALGSLAGSFFSTAQVPINNFTTRFTFHELGVVGGMADGIGFCIQRAAPTAIGSGGGYMGYFGILTSVFVKLDNYNNESSTGIYVNGADPQGGSIDMRASGVDVHSQHDFQVDMSYNGTALAMTVKDLTTNAVFSTSFTIDIATTIGGATAYVGFTGGTGGAVANQEVLNWTYANLPAPTGLTALNGVNMVTLNWTASAGAASYNVLRATVPGGPYGAPLATGIAGTMYVDNSASYPNTYYYVVQAVSGVLTSNYSNEVQGIPLQPWVTATPNSGLFTNENGAATFFYITFTQAAPAAGSLVTVTSSNPGEGRLSTPSVPGLPATTLVINVLNGFTGQIPITVTGIDDFVADGPITYTISVTATNIGGLAIPNVTVTNNDNDTPGITFSQLSGLATTESGGLATFTVSLNTQPYGTITMSLTSSNALEGTVSPASLTFTPGAGPNAWNAAHLVTVTGVDDTLLDFTIPYTIITGTLGISDVRDNAGYNFDPPDVQCVNIDNEVIPALPHVWGGSGGGGGGCGLLGLEAGLALLLAALRRRR